MSNKKKSKIIIQGITEEGTKFRPADWAQRVSGNLSTFKNHRIYYSPLLTPSYHEGESCVLLDPQLKEINPDLYHYILQFAQTNKLKICGEEEEEQNEDVEK